MPYRYYYDTEGKSPMLEKIRKMRPEYQSTGYMQGFLAAMLLTEAAPPARDPCNELNGKNLKIALNSIRTVGGSIPNRLDCSPVIWTEKNLVVSFDVPGFRVH